MVRRVTLLAVLVAGVARAHLVPIPPSTCTFDPLELRVPALGLTGAASAAGGGDVVRLTYDASANQVQVCGTAGGDGTHCDAVPRPFTLGGVSGTLTLPALFQGHMLSSGDITLSDVPLTIAAGGTGMTTAVTLTTALATADGAVLGGRPLQGLESFVLVGVIDGAALPGAFGGRSLVLSLSCLPRPVPDKDQFQLPLVLGSIRGDVTSKLIRLRATADVASVPPDVSVGPTLVAVAADGATFAAAAVPGGLRGRKTQSGKSADGNGTITVKRTQRKGATRLTFDVRLKKVVLPTGLAGRVVLSLTLDAGGTIGRGERLFRVSKGGKRLRPD
jgi:hypothetical protein